MKLNFWMAGHRVGEAGFTVSGPSHHHHHNIPYAVFRGLNPPTATFINQEGGGFDFGELEEAIVLQGVNKISNNDEAKPSLYTARPAATLEMFPSWPTGFQHTARGSSKSGDESTDSGSAVNNNNTISSRAEAAESPSSRQLSSEQNQVGVLDHHQKHLQIPQNLPLLQQQQEMASDSPRTDLSQSQPAPKSNQEKRKGPGSSEKPLDAKTLRRLAQNREAAKKSRLRKKAYVQQLESSRIRLAQLEQVIQGARSHGIFLGGGANPGPNISSGAAVFDMEYARWLDDDQRHTSELRTALQAHLADADLRLIVDACVAHYDEIFRLKEVVAKSDIFHLITGIWKTPAERCFLWMGGFRPSELIKMLIGQLDPLTEQQVVGIYGLQQSSQQAEEALSQGLEQLQQSLVETMATAGAVNDGMHHMAVALGKLANLEHFVRQGDNLRQQTLHQLRRILTVRQAARCFLVIGEYYGRLRALSSLWASRPREALMGDENSCQTTTDLHMVQSSQNHFPNF